MPFPFYNTSAPSPSTKNSITNTATGLGYRDYLLNRNLLPQYPFLSTSTNGGPRIGEPVLDTSINGNSNVIPIGLPLETEGLLRYEIAILPNQFKNDEPTAPELFSIEYITQTQGIFGNVDFPQGTQSYPTTANDQVEEYGIFGKTNYAEFRKTATLYNLYVDTAKQIDMADFITLQPTGFAQQLDSYLDVFGGLNGGGNAGIQAANIIGSVLDGNGLGLAKGGIVTNYDVRASLIGRVLGATGLINDTKLGLIGGQQLALALANNAAFNLQEEILGGLNIEENILSLVKTGNLSGFRPNYTITVPGSTGGRIADFTSRVLGFEVPRSFLQNDGSIFQSESGNVDNITRANAMILNTGKGQVKSLISNVFANINGTTENDNPSNTAFRSGYVPGYTDNKGQKAINPNLYAFYNSDKATIYPFVVTNQNDVIPEINYNREQMVSDYGFKSPEETFTGPVGNAGYNNRKISDVGFTWTTGVEGNVNNIPDFDELDTTGNFLPKKSLLVKTQKLFNSKGMKNIITAKGEMGYTSTQITTANGDGISKGSAVLNGDLYNANGNIDKGANAENTYCRSWTTLNRYDTVSKMVRNSGLTETSNRFGTNYFRFNTEHSTLDDNGFVKIAPYVDDVYSDFKVFGTVSDVKNYMFSIENLAWNDNVTDLPPVEQGIGDTITGKRGRIMWFPPYNIQFNESSSVSWESTNFIGRGEPVYTYNNTERSATLSFSIIVDHSSYMNSFRGTNGPSDNYVASFIAGCVDPSSNFANKLTVPEKSALAESLVQQAQSQVLDNGNVGDTTIKVYFPNDVYTINYSTPPNGTYENGDNNGIGLVPGQQTPPNNNGNPIPNASFSNYEDNKDFGLNSTNPISKITIKGTSYNGILDPNLMPALKSYMENECKYCTIDVYGFASVQGNVSDNKKLAEKRAESIKQYLLDNGVKNDAITVKTENLGSNTGCPAGLGTEKINNEQCKKDRRAEIRISFDFTKAIDDTVKAQPVEQTVLSNFNPKIANRFYNESLYFEKLKQTDSFVFDSFRDKIKYFHPAFHSTTPEGLNSRLTFLQQCTRQGPTDAKENPTNLAFGRPPICILRLGDFFHTKVVIDNLTIDYEPLVWDLNPEGIGVQPMIANVTLSLKLIGGSSLAGPINKLQNALSFNYYANTRVYDERADYIKINTTIDNKNGETRLSGSTIVDGITDVNSKRAADRLLKQIASPKPVVAQEAANEQALDDAAKKAPETTPSSGTTEPQITGFKRVYIKPFNISEKTYQIYVVLKQSNLFDDNGNQLVTDEELKQFLNKDITITLDTINQTSTSIIEEVINTQNIGLENSKSITSLFGSGYYLGETEYIVGGVSIGEFITKSLDSNAYKIALRYNGKPIANLSVTIDDEDQVYEV